MLKKSGHYNLNWIFFVCSFIGLMYQSTYANIIHVGKNEVYKSIKNALENSSPNDTILIKSGFYKEGNIIINKPITFLGENYPVLSGENKYEILTITSPNVNIEGIKFINTGISFIDDNAAVKVEKSYNCKIKNNIFVDNFFSIYLAESANCVVSKNKIRASQTTETRSGNGIHLWYCKNIKIEDNQISGHRDGIYFEFVEKSEIKNNLSENNIRYGLHFMYSDSCSYTNNTFKENGAGVAVMYTKYVIMTHNHFEKNWGAASYGILLKDITDSEITNNTFYKNSSAIYIEGSNRIIVTNNDFIENGWAIRLMANSMDNLFEKNNFLRNSFDVATNSSQNYNLFNYNYWSDYSGYDLDRNNIGDVPYRPVKLFSLIVEQNSPTLILIRSIFVNILDTAENLFPVLTPETLIDNKPAMKKF